MTFRVQIVYPTDYPFDIRKYEKIYKRLLVDKKISDQHASAPEPLTRKQLLLIHSVLPIVESVETESFWETLLSPSFPPDRCSEEHSRHPFIQETKPELSITYVNSST
jgi:acetoin utilization deacetylase AcuC-like enzyme